MVEIQPGSIDITQSITAKEIVNAYSKIPGPLTALKRAVWSGALGLSCSRDHLVRKNEIRFQIKKYKAERAMNPGAFRYFPAIQRMCGSAASFAGSSHGYKL